MNSGTKRRHALYCKLLDPEEPEAVCTCGGFAKEEPMIETWDFSDEALVSELRRCIELLKEARQREKEMHEQVIKMRKQHYDFIHNFAPPIG